MAKLRELLEDTMLLTAKPDADFNAFDAGQPNDVNVGHGGHLQPWNFKLATTGPPTIADLTCFLIEPKKSFDVCSELSFGDVAVAVGNMEYELPLESDFILGIYTTDDGTIPKSNSHPLWRLAAEVTRGIQLVYGYRLRDKGRGLEPYPAGTDEDFDFFSEQARSNKRVKAKRARSKGGAGDADGDTTTVDTSTIIAEVLVCASLVCCSGAKDFEPTGNLESCRFYPQISLIASKRLSKARGRVTMIRPSKSGMGHHSDMTHQISAGLFTDRNQFKFSTRTALTATWEDIFDYYQIDPPDGLQLRAVRLTNENMEPRLEEAHIRKEWHFNRLRDSVVKKSLRQGEFDNLHLAPKMKHKKKEVFMAPVCQHDCVHTHWRWGNGITARNFRGWSAGANPEPFSKVGAPLVPPNQAVTITMTAGPGLHYDVFIDGPIEKQTLQVINHHGSAYARKLDIPAGDFVVDGGFYDSMRFEDSHERVQYRGGDAGLLELRRLGSLDGEDEMDLWKRIIVSEPAEVDHVIPKRIGGQDDERNMQ